MLCDAGSSIRAETVLPLCNILDACPQGRGSSRQARAVAHQRVGTAWPRNIEDLGNLNEQAFGSRAWKMYNDLPGAAGILTYRRGCQSAQSFDSHRHRGAASRRAGSQNPPARWRGRRRCWTGFIEGSSTSTRLRRHRDRLILPSLPSLRRGRCRPPGRRHSFLRRAEDMWDHNRSHRLMFQALVEMRTQQYDQAASHLDSAASLPITFTEPSLEVLWQEKMIELLTLTGSDGADDHEARAHLLRRLAPEQDSSCRIRDRQPTGISRYARWNGRACIRNLGQRSHSRCLVRGPSVATVATYGLATVTILTPTRTGLFAPLTTPFLNRFRFPAGTLSRVCATSSTLECPARGV